MNILMNIRHYNAPANFDINYVDLIEYDMLEKTWFENFLYN